MKIGDTIHFVRFDHLNPTEDDHEVAVLDDRVLPDRTCGQVEAGWWAYKPAHENKEVDDFFISDDGIVYGPDIYSVDAENYNPSFTVAIGKVVTPN